MSTSPFDAQGRQYAWDATSINLAETCLRKYYLKMVAGWQPRNLSIHLQFGQHYATALEHYHKHRALGKDKDEALDEVLREVLINTWQYEWHDEDPEGGSNYERLIINGLGHRGSIGPVEWLHNAKTRQNLVRTIVWYIEEFANDPIETVILNDGSPAVELSFTLEVDNDLLFCGHIDKVCLYGGDYYPLDNKTTGSTITPRYFEQFSPNTQMSMYSFVGKVVYDMPVKGMIIDAAQIAVGFSRFERGFTFRTQTQLDEWYDSTMYHIEAARQAVEQDRFPMNTSACDKYGGCEFRGICSRSPEVREQSLKADFVQGPIWNPLRKR